MSRYDEVKELAMAWNRAWNSRDPKELAAFFGPDSTYYEPDLNTGPVPGAQGVVASAVNTWKDWPEAEFSTVSLTIEASRVVLEWQSSATHRTGKVVQLEGVDILQWAGDKLVSARVYYDEHSRRKQLAD
jgi:hypothetical protein